jgi:rubredoxin
MTETHKCTNCGLEFELSRKVYVKTGWGRSLAAGLRPLAQQFEDYQKVMCPRCGHIEKDERILSYGLFKPRTVIYVILAIMVLLLIADLLKL